MGGSNTQPEQYKTAQMMDRMNQETYPMLKKEKYEVLDPAGEEAANYTRIEKQGMSDDFDQEVIGAVKDLGKMAKKNIVDPAISAGKNVAQKLFGDTSDEVVAKEMYPLMINKKYDILDNIPYAELDPKYATKIKGMISPSGIQQNTSLDKVRYDRNASGSEFKGVKAKPYKSIINMTTDEAMQDL
jgi:hypothetical protein